MFFCALTLWIRKYHQRLGWIFSSLTCWKSSQSSTLKCSFGSFCSVCLSFIKVYSRISGETGKKHIPFITFRSTGCSIGTYNGLAIFSIIPIYLGSIMIPYNKNPKQPPVFFYHCRAVLHAKKKSPSPSHPPNGSVSPEKPQSPIEMHT